MSFDGSEVQVLKDQKDTKPIRNVSVALYARVSRDDLNCENQLRILRDWVERQKETNYKEFIETQSTRKTRPVKAEILERFRKGEFRTIVVVRIDRFARSLQELVMDVESIIGNGGRFVSIMNNFEFDKANYNASQQLMLNIFASFAQFEKEIIRERTLEGLARARAQGRIGGRPWHKRKDKPPLVNAEEKNL